MKQYDHKSSNNLDRYVKESLEGVTYKDVIDMVAEDQSESLEILRLNKGAFLEILNEYGNSNGCKMGNLLSFEYVRSGHNYYKYSLVKKERCALAKFKLPEDRRKTCEDYVDQLIVLNDYRGSFYTLLWRQYFKYRFPVLCDDIFYKESVKKDYITLRKFIEENPSALDMKVDEVKSALTVDSSLREMPCKEWKVKIYDNNFGTWLMFIETENKMAYVDVKAMVDKDWNLLVGTMKEYEGSHNGFMTDEVLESKEIKYLKQNWFEK